jgi:hypothetical protein
MWCKGAYGEHCPLHYVVLWCSLFSLLLTWVANGGGHHYWVIFKHEIGKPPRRYFICFGHHRALLETIMWIPNYFFPSLINNTCRNPSFGLATKAKGLQGCGPKGSSRVTSGTPGSVGKCEGVNPHTPKATPVLGDGVPMDSQNFRDRFEGSNLNGLWRSLYQWKDLEA